VRSIGASAVLVSPDTRSQRTANQVGGRAGALVVPRPGGPGLHPQDPRAPPVSCSARLPRDAPRDAPRLPLRRPPWQVVVAQDWEAMLGEAER
jgi:hypothetical protein